MHIHAVIQKPLRITDPAIEEEIRTPLCFSESLGHFFGAAIMNEAGTGAADLTGASVTANFIRGDGIYGTINGTVSGNVAYVVLPSWCYRATGRFTLTVFLNLGTASRAIIIARGRVMADTTDTAVDPEHIIPSIAELLAQISACISATEAANTAASNANGKAALADTAAGNANDKASVANTAAGNANTAAGAANTAAGTANAAAGKIDNMTVAASGLATGAPPTAQISEVSGHKHIAFGIPQGAKGDKGDKGDTGTQGPKGDTGATGATGATGPQGPKGDTGAQGPKGDPGDVSSVNGISPDGNGNVTIPNATQSDAGMMSATDKTKLDGLPSTAATQSAMGLMSAADKTKLDGLPASAAVPGSIAIIVDGDTAGTAVAPGAYAYIKNNTHGLAEGLYKNKSSSAFPVSGGTADSTVFEAVSGGGINALSDQIANLGRKTVTPSSNLTFNSAIVSANGLSVYKLGSLCIVNGWVAMKDVTVTGDNLICSGLPFPQAQLEFIASRQSDNSTCSVYITPSGNLLIASRYFVGGSSYAINAVYIES